VVTIPRDQPEKDIHVDGYGEKDFEKRKVLRQKWKTPRERPTSGPWSEHDNGEELGDYDDGSNW